jgi:hypothetical protein
MHAFETVQDERIITPSSSSSSSVGDVIFRPRTF